MSLPLSFSDKLWPDKNVTYQTFAKTDDLWLWDKWNRKHLMF